MLSHCWHWPWDRRRQPLAAYLHCPPLPLTREHATSMGGAQMLTRAARSRLGCATVNRCSHEQRCRALAARPFLPGALPCGRALLPGTPAAAKLRWGLSLKISSLSLKNTLSFPTFPRTPQVSSPHSPQLGPNTRRSTVDHYQSQAVTRRLRGCREQPKPQTISPIRPLSTRMRET